MEIHLTQAQEQELMKIAQHRGQSAESMAQEAVGAFLAEQTRHREAIREARESVLRSGSLSHEELVARIETRMLVWP